MIYFTIPKKNIKQENKWIKDNLDKFSDTDTFIINKEDDSGNEFAVISIPDDGSTYAEEMKKHFDKEFDIEDLEKKYDKKALRKEKKALDRMALKEAKSAMTIN